MDTVVCAWAIRWHSSSPCLPHLLLLLLRLPPGSSRRSSSSSSTASLSTWRLAGSVVDTVVGMDMMYMAHGYCNGLRRNGLRRNGHSAWIGAMDTAQQWMGRWIRCNEYGLRCNGYGAMDPLLRHVHCNIHAPLLRNPLRRVHCTVSIASYPWHHIHRPIHCCAVSCRTHCAYPCAVIHCGVIHSGVIHCGVIHCNIHAQAHPPYADGYGAMDMDTVQWIWWGGLGQARGTAVASACLTSSSPFLFFIRLAAAGAAAASPLLAPGAWRKV